MDKELIPIRLSHLLGQSGVGSIVRGATGMVVIQDTRQWTDKSGNAAGREIPYVERVRMALNIDEVLREPPVATQIRNGKVDGVCVPATKFPTWMRCPKCGALKRWPWRETSNGQSPICSAQSGCKFTQLEQLTWVVADEDGHLADVDWHYLIHNDQRDSTKSKCKVRDQMSLIEAGYNKRELKCAACKAKVIFTGSERVFLGNSRMQPWTKNDLIPDESSAKQPAEVLAINDTRVYSPKTETVLVIPPESRVRKGTVVDRLYRSSSDRSRIDSARTPLAKKSVMKSLATEYRCATSDIYTALSDLDNGYPLYGANFTQGQLMESEFQAFLEELPDQREDEDLVTYNRSELWHSLHEGNELNITEQHILRGIKNLVRVDRLKAIRVFEGFSRMGGDKVVSPDILQQSSWLPALELYGEGVFIALDDARLRAWEQLPAVVSRLDQLAPRFVQSGREQPNPLTPRFMLLHTLSHLLMRQIESEGGYPAASLLERIYCAESPEPMAGILIHVAVPDIAGSLGGLAELSEPHRFLGILMRALEHSRWCSLDPVCSEHEGQGPGLLNRAACHACAMVPEPACEYGNTLLDRCFVKGDSEHGLPSFFETF